MQCQPEVDSLEHVGGVEFRVGRQKIPCSIHARQIGALRFPYRMLGSTRDIFRLWGGELVVSDRFVNLVQQRKFTGATFSPTCDTQSLVARLGKKKQFAQLGIKSKPLNVTEDTRFGETPFDTQRTGYQQCEGGQSLGTDPSLRFQYWDRVGTGLTSVRRKYVLAVEEDCFARIGFGSFQTESWKH